MTTTRHAVQGSIRTADGLQTKIYPAKTFAHAEQMLTDLEGVQTRQGLKVDAAIVIVGANAPTTPTVAETSPSVPAFYRDDLRRFDETFKKADAIVTTTDGFSYIDETKVPAPTLSAYRLLLRFGAANGLPLSLAEIDASNARAAA